MNTSLTLMNTSPKPPLKVKLQELMRGSKKLILEHGDKPYLLSITRKGKLILTAADESPAITKDQSSSAEK